MHPPDYATGHNTTFSGKTKQQALKNTDQESEQWNDDSKGVGAGRQKPPWMNATDSRCSYTCNETQ